MNADHACPRYCPGCSHRELSEAQSLHRKSQWVRQKLARWQERIAPIQGPSPEARTGYRDKVCLSASWEGQIWHIGLVSGDAVVPIPKCPVHSRRTNAAATCFARALPPSSDFPLLYYAQSGAQVTLVVKSRQMPAISWLDAPFSARLENIGIEGVWLHRHPSAGRRVFAKNWWDLLWGKARSMDRQGLAYGPTAFQQLIPELYEQALDEAQNFLTAGPDDLVLDLYCGTGGGLSRWCHASGHVIGVELSGESISCARENAPAAIIYRGSCRHRLPQLTRELKKCAGRRLLFVNPPRTGIEPELCHWITSLCRPDRIAYLSCSAGTLQRDLKDLETKGYRVEQITPYDFFPQTHHAEILALARLPEKTGQNPDAAHR